jgi:hypothetical protein
LVQLRVQHVGGFAVAQRRRRCLDLIESDLHGGPGGKRQYIHRVRPRKHGLGVGRRSARHRPGFGAAIRAAHGPPHRRNSR